MKDFANELDGMPSITLENNVIHNNEGYGVILVKPGGEAGPADRSEGGRSSGVSASFCMSDTDLMVSFSQKTLLQPQPRTGSRIRPQSRALLRFLRQSRRTPARRAATRPPAGSGSSAAS